MAWRLYMIVESGFCRREFRRFVFSAKASPKCPGPASYHDASVVVERLYLDRDFSMIPDFDTMKDPRWPSHCACGYMFQLDDEWQENRFKLWSGAPDGKEYALRDKLLPPGACRVEDDGLIFVRLPDGEDFCPTFPGMREQWTVSGTPPNLTFAPSINAVGTYHGFVSAGALSDCVEGKKFPQFPATA